MNQKGVKCRVLFLESFQCKCSQGAGGERAASFSYVTIIISSKSSGKAEGRSLGEGTLAVKSVCVIPTALLISLRLWLAYQPDKELNTTWHSDWGNCLKFPATGTIKWAFEWRRIVVPLGFLSPKDNISRLCPARDVTSFTEIFTMLRYIGYWLWYVKDYRESLSWANCSWVQGSWNFNFSGGGWRSFPEL